MGLLHPAKNKKNKKKQLTFPKSVFWVRTETKKYSATSVRLRNKKSSPLNRASSCIYKYVYDDSFFRGFGQEFFSDSASVCDSRNWNSRSNSFVRAPSSGGGSNAPRPAVSVPHLAGIGWPGSGTWAERDKREGRKFLYFGRYMPELFLDLGIYMQSLNEKNIWENIYFHLSIISKLGSSFVPTTLFAWSHLEAFGLLSYDCCVVAFR